MPSLILDSGAALYPHRYRIPTNFLRRDGAIKFKSKESVTKSLTSRVLRHNPKDLLDTEDDWELNFAMYVQRDFAGMRFLRLNNYAGLKMISLLDHSPLNGSYKIPVPIDLGTTN